MCSYTDAGGLSATVEATYEIVDTTAPTIDPHADVGPIEATSALGAIVTYVSPATHDAVDGDGVATCTPASGSTFALGDTTVTCNASDAVGNAAAATSFVVHVVDTIPPTITYVSRTAANGNGWNNGNVTVTWSCSDSGAGVVNASVSQTVSNEGAGQSATGTCTDLAGHSASDTQTGINIDKTAPTLTFGAPSPAANLAGWNNTNVSFAFTPADVLSGVDTTNPASSPLVLTSEGSAVTGNVTVTDKAGNSATFTSPAVDIDKTAPTASPAAAPAPNANGWNKTDVTVTFSGSDSLSGIDICDAPVVLSSEGAGQSASGSCTDKAGNVSALATASGISIDKTAPSVSLVGGPANGASYYFGSVPAAPTCNASDVLSGVDGACSISGYNAVVGSHTVIASATDKAGNNGSASASYTVLAWTLKGFYQPVDMSGVLNTVKNGSTVPLKFEVFAGSTELTDVGMIKSFTQTKVTCSTGAEDAIEEIVSTGGTSLRYDTTGGQFIQNWKTPTGAGNCYKVTMTTQDGSTLSALFKLK
jgi:hypothetical protein